MAGKTRKQQLEEMLAEDPGDPFLRYGLAMEHVSAGEPEAALGCFRDLVAASPDYVPAYLQAGQLLARLGRTDEARDAFRRGIDAARRQGDQHAQAEMEGMLDGLD